MKIRKSQLRRIIKEEKAKLLREKRLLRQYIREDLKTETLYKEACCKLVEFFYVNHMCMLHESSLNEIKASEILDDIKKTLLVAKARAVGGKVWSFVKDKLKDKGLDLAMNAAGTIPIIGNAASGIKLSKDIAKIGIEAAMELPEIVGAATEITKIAAGEYVGMDDSAVGKNPLAKVFNIDDRMEYPLKDEYLKDFASKFAKYLTDNPDSHYPSRESAAEMGLEAWLQNNAKTAWATVKAPADPA